MCEVEAQPIGRDQRAFLRDVIAEHLHERVIEQVCRRLVRADLLAARVVDLELDRVADCERAGLDLADQDERVTARLLGVVDPDLRAPRQDDACVADLAAGLGVERRLIERDRDVRAGIGVIASPRTARTHPEAPVLTMMLA